MAATKNPAPGWDRRGALGQAALASGSLEKSNLPLLPQRTRDCRSPRAVILSHGIQRCSPSDRAGRPVFVVETATENGTVLLAAICSTRKAAEDEVLRHLAADIAFVDRTGGAP